MEKEGVFISHITEESSLGRLLKNFLKEVFGDDLKVFPSSDYESIESGEGYFQAILSALRSSEAVIVLLSKESVNRPWINFETGIGKGTEALVVPALVRGLSKVEVIPPLSHLQLRSFEDPDDLSGALKDIARKLNRSTVQPDAQGFVAALKSAGLTLTTKVVLLTPYLESRSSGGHYLRFKLTNGGNQNINLDHLEARVPTIILESAGWSPPADPAVVDPSRCDENGVKYLRLRYTTYQGARTPNYHHVERLPAILASDTSLPLGYHFSFPIKSIVADAERTLPIYYRIVAQNANFPSQAITLGDLLNQLTGPSDKSDQADIANTSQTNKTRPRTPRVIGRFLS